MKRDKFQERRNAEWSRALCCPLDPRGVCCGHAKWMPLRVSYWSHRIICALTEWVMVKRHMCVRP